MIDVVVYDHAPGTLTANRRCRTGKVADALTAAGYEVRSVIVINANTGLTSTSYNDRMSE